MKAPGESIPPGNGFYGTCSGVAFECVTRLKRIVRRESVAIFIHKGEYRSMTTLAAGLDRTLVALADPTRRAIVERLTEGEARVTDLAAPFAISLNSVSKHIRMLERADLVRRRRVGREHFLALNPSALDGTAAWIEEQRSLWTLRLAALDALLKAEDRAKDATTAALD